MRRKLLILIFVVFALVASFALMSKVTQASMIHMSWHTQAHLIDGDPTDGSGGGG